MKEKPNKTTIKKEKADERMIETMRKACEDFDFGEGAEIFLASKGGKPNDQRIVSHFFTSKTPKLQIKSGNIHKTLDIEMSSVEEENQSLLHLLFTKMRNK